MESTDLIIDYSNEETLINNPLKNLTFLRPSCYFHHYTVPFHNKGHTVPFHNKGHTVPFHNKGHTLVLQSNIPLSMPIYEHIKYMTFLTVLYSLHRVS